MKHNIIAIETMPMVSPVCMYGIDMWAGAEKEGEKAGK